MGEEEEDNEENDSGGENDGDNGMVCYDETDSSRTNDAEIAEVIGSTPADCLAEIYADEENGSLSESDPEDRGTGANMYTGGWMKWNSK